jgi:hypothetical protein
MVFYYKARPDAGDYTIYMGADKNENEELIKYGLPEDVWYEHFPLSLSPLSHLHLSPSPFASSSSSLPLYLSPLYLLSIFLTLVSLSLSHDNTCASSGKKKYTCTRVE